MKKKTRKSLTECIIQKYVDHKLNSMRCDYDDLSDYLQNYTNNEYLVDLKLLAKKWNVSPEDFICGFKPQFAQIKKAIKNSSMLEEVAKRYKAAVVKGITEEIYYHCVDADKEAIGMEIEEDKEITEIRALHSLRTKLNKYKLTQAERNLLKQKLK